MADANPCLCRSAPSVSRRVRRGRRPSSFLQGVTDVAAGTFFALAVLNNNTVVSWGSNTSGQLGNAAVNTSVFEPVAVCAIKVKSCPPGSPPSAFLSGVQVVSAGDASSLALQGHTALAWGNNRYGEVGNGTITGPDTCSHFACSQAPLVVTKLKLPVSAISAGNYHDLVIVDGPTGKPVGVDAWGSNSDGQVGVGSRRGKRLPWRMPNNPGRCAWPLERTYRHLGRPFLQSGPRRRSGDGLGRQPWSRSPRQRNPPEHADTRPGVRHRGEVVPTHLTARRVPAGSQRHLGWRDRQPCSRRRDRRRLGFQLSRRPRDRNQHPDRKPFPDPRSRNST